MEISITLSVNAVTHIREALKLTPQQDRDAAWSEAWSVVRDALADNFDACNASHKGTNE